MSEDNMNIPHTLPLDINKWTCSDVETFSQANRDEYQLEDTDISAIRTARFNGRGMVRLDSREGGPPKLWASKGSYNMRFSAYRGT